MKNLLLIVLSVLLFACMPKEPPMQVDFIVIGDMGTGSEKQYKVAHAIEQVCAQKKCDFALGLGDNIYEAGVSSEEDTQFLDKFELPYENLDFPFYMVLGNHDNSVPALPGAGLHNFSGEYQVNYTYKKYKITPKWQMPSRYYKFSYPLPTDANPYTYLHQQNSEETKTRNKLALVDFFALDSSPLAGLSDWNPKYWQVPYLHAHQEWLDYEIKKSFGDWKIAFAHHPYLSNGRHGNAGFYDFVPGLGFSYKRFFEQSICGRIDLFLSGHDHDMQWLKSVPQCGKTEFIISGAAAKSRSLSNANRNKAFYQKGEQLGFFHIRIQKDLEQGINELRAEVYEVDSETSAVEKAFERTIKKPVLGFGL